MLCGHKFASNKVFDKKWLSSILLSAYIEIILKMLLKKTMHFNPLIIVSGQ